MLWYSLLCDMVIDVSIYDFKGQLYTWKTLSI